MTSVLRSFRQRFPGFSDILVGILVGAGVTKVYYETTNTTGQDKTSKRQQEIKKILESNSNLRYGKHLRTIDAKKVEEEFDVVDGKREFSKYGVPQNPLRYLKYTNHWVCYDQAKKIPIWVAEHLTRDKVQGEAQRELANFTPDHNIPAEFQSGNTDFLGTGWARGHMAPAADSKYNQDAMNETFFLSNIVPQNHDNNENFWFRLETYCRTLTKRYSDVYVISGPLFLPSDSKSEKRVVQYEVIGENQVAVPTHLYKVIVTENKNNPPLLGAFIVPNQPISNDHQLQEFEVAMETITKNSGITFFSEKLTKSARSLCKVDGCKLLSKEFMENIILSRKLRNCKSAEELDNLWKDVTDKRLTQDHFISNVYNEKKALFIQEKNEKKPTAS